MLYAICIELGLRLIWGPWAFFLLGSWGPLGPLGPASIAIRHSSALRPPPEAPSATELFKREFIDSEKAGGRKVNPGTHDFWNKFRPALTALSAERWANFERRHELLVQVAAHNRRARKAREAAAQRALAMEQAPGQPSTAIVPVRAGPAATTVLRAGTALVGIQNPPSGACPVAPPPESLRPEYPLSADYLDNIINERTITKRVASFREDAHTVAAPDIELPENVVYETQCCGACEKEFPDVIDMQDHLLD